MTSTPPLAGRVALYGGSFNPPHVGHQMACLYALEVLGAEAVWLLPAAVHPFAKVLVPFEARLEMCRRMAAPFGVRVHVSAIEEELAAQGTQGRTYFTVKYLQEKYPELSFAWLVGADVLAETDRWYRWDELNTMLPVVPVGRAGVSQAGFEGGVDLPEISSTALRADLAVGRSVLGRVPLGVARYIEDHALYMPLK